MLYAGFEAFTAVMFQVEVLCVVVGHLGFTGPCCLHLHFTLNMEAALVSYHNTEDLDLKHLRFSCYSANC